MSRILDLCATSRVQHAKVIFRNARGLASDSRDSSVTAAGRPGFSQASVREKRCSSSRLSVTPLYLPRHVERVFCVSFTRAKLMRLRAVQPPRSLSSVSFPPRRVQLLGDHSSPGIHRAHAFPPGCETAHRPVRDLASR